MKKYNFRLTPLLKLREHRERERQREHSEAVSKVLAHREVLKRNEQKKGEITEAGRGRLVGNVSVAEALVYSRFLLKLKRDALSEREILKGCEIEAEKKRRKLVEASRERKVYELLKEKQEARHYAEMERQEQIQSDEIASTAFVRKKKGTK